MKKELLFLNDRGADELEAANTYRYAATCFQAKGLFGFQAFCRAESATELTHRDKLEDFANDIGEELDMPVIPRVEFDDETPEGILNHLLEMELALLDAYKKGMELDPVIQPLVLKMIDIQRKGVGEIRDIISSVKSKGVGLVDNDLK